MSDKRYTAADVNRIIGMDRNTLFYCVKTLGLITPAQAKPKAILYDFKNLLDLALIHQLLELGMNQGAIKKALSEPITSAGRVSLFFADQSEEYQTIWHCFACERLDYEVNGCVLMFQKETKEEDPYFTMMSLKRAFDHMEMFWAPVITFVEKDPDKRIAVSRPFGHVIMVDILGLVTSVEELTGEKLAASPVEISK